MPRNIHIVGGGGGIGRWFAAHVFAGHNVHCYDISSKNLEDIPSEANACLVEQNNFSRFAGQFQESDWVILAVPQQTFINSLAGVIKVIHKDTLVVCFTSVQAGPLREMKRSIPKSCTYFGCHPLFGHFVNSPAGQIVACALYDKKQAMHVQFLNHLKSIGLIPTFLTPAKHDKAMAFVQAWTHFSLLGLLKALDDSKLPLVDLVKLKTPNFQFLLAFASRVIRQAPTTLGSIQSTREAAIAREAMIGALSVLHGQLDKRDAKGCSDALNEMRKQLIGKEEIEEGVEVAALAVDGLQRFEELLLRHKASGHPFVFRHGTTRALKFVRILEIGHNDIKYEEATKKISQSDGHARYAVGLTDSARENYNRMGLSCPNLRTEKIRKGNVKLLTTAELTEFKRSAIIPAETVHTFRKQEEFSARVFLNQFYRLWCQDLTSATIWKNFGRRFCCG